MKIDLPDDYDSRDLPTFLDLYTAIEETNRKINELIQIIKNIEEKK